MIRLPFSFLPVPQSMSERSWLGLGEKCLYFELGLIAATGSVAWSPSTGARNPGTPENRFPKRLAPLDAEKTLRLAKPGSNPLGLAQGIEKQRSWRGCEIWATVEKWELTAPSRRPWTRTPTLQK